eukprot:jgi/Botrbrau1/21671/Bobra.43_1s0069.1
MQLPASAKKRKSSVRYAGPPKGGSGGSLAGNLVPVQAASLILIQADASADMYDVSCPLCWNDHSRNKILSCMMMMMTMDDDDDDDDVDVEGVYDVSCLPR